jgi:Ni,Fe-hydrogenase maturation factor
MKTLVLGIGNTILGDDGVGVLTVQELAGQISDAILMSGASVSTA